MRTISKLTVSQKTLELYVVLGGEGGGGTTTEVTIDGDFTIQQSGSVYTMSFGIHNFDWSSLRAGWTGTVVYGQNTLTFDSTNLNNNTITISVSESQVDFDTTTATMRINSGSDNYEGTSSVFFDLDYFYVEKTGGVGGNLKLVMTENNPTPGTYATTVQLSYDKRSWTTHTIGNNSQFVLPLNQKIYLRNDSGVFNTTNGGFELSDSWRVVTITITAPDNQINTGGDLKTLLDYKHLDSVVVPSGAFARLFNQETNLVSAANLNVPNTVSVACCHSMFYGCTSLTSAPALPATTLAEYCYRDMFRGCTSLTAAPTLPATTMSLDCYANMFYGCTSLATAPALPATTLYERCYASMFNGCSALTSAPALPATTMQLRCYNNMFKNCTSLVTPPALPATSLAETCYTSMFFGCSSLTTAPALPATTLYSECYYQMFRDCTSLTVAPELPATTLVQYCYKDMFNGCSQLNIIITYANDISATDCLQNWVKSVANSGTFYNNGSATYTTGNNGIPTGWTEVLPPDYMYVENLNNGTNTLTLTTTKVGNPSISDYSDTVEYSKDKINWTTIFFDTSTPYNITMNQGEKVYFRNYNGLFNYTDSGASNYYVTTITCSESHNIGGNVTTILDYTDKNVNIPTGCFYRLFIYNNTLQAANITFNDNIAESCYREMFKGCTSLTTPPAILPATTLASSCYRAMFDSTISLTTTPELPADRVLTYSCAFMFQGSGITSATLKATKIENNGCQRIFRDCPINSLTVYANTISGSNAINNWLSGVSPTGTFYNLGSATYNRGASGIPTGWTEYKCKLSNVVLTNTTGTQYSVTANMEWSSSLSWEQAEILILDQGGEQPAYLDFLQPEVVNGVLTPSTVMDFVDTPQPENYCEITLYDDQGNMVFNQTNIPYTIQ